jgi:hypothetical protein
MVGVRLLPLPQHLIHLSSQFAAPKPNLPILGSYLISTSGRRATTRGTPQRRCQQIGHDAPIDNTELITTYVRQVEVRRTEIAISLLSEDQASEDENDNPLVLTVPWSKTPHRRHRDVIAPEGPRSSSLSPPAVDRLGLTNNPRIKHCKASHLVACGHTV